MKIQSQESCGKAGLAGSRSPRWLLLLVALLAGFHAGPPSALAAGGAVSGDSPGFPGIVAGGTVVEKVLDGFQLAEGPAASRLGYLLFSDAANNKIWKYIPKGSADVFEGGASASKPGLIALRDQSNGALGLTFDRQGRLLACEAGARRVTRTEKDGRITVLAERFGDKRLNGPDDILHAIDGTTYFTDPPPGQGGGEQPRAGVYQIMRNGELRVVSTELEAPAGLALSPEQRILYVSDAAQNNIRAFEIKGDGVLVNGRIFATMKSTGDGAAGGLKTDLKGNVYGAGPGGIWIFDKDGRHLGTIAMPEAATNLGWGDNYNALYITTRTSLYRIALKATGSRTY